MHTIAHFNTTTKTKEGKGTGRHIKMFLTTKLRKYFKKKILLSVYSIDIKGFWYFLVGKYYSKGHRELIVSRLKIGAKKGRETRSNYFM